jgi:hypothetical protein
MIFSKSIPSKMNSEKEKDPSKKARAKGENVTPKTVM